MTEELPRKRIQDCHNDVYMENQWRDEKGEDLKDCQNDVHVDNQWSNEKEREYEEEMMKERKERDLS